MTASAPTRADFATLDGQITRALSTLRLARTVSARGRTRGDLDAERRAEANLNALLDYRNARRK